MSEELTNLSGYLLDWPDHAVGRQDLTNCPRLHFIGEPRHSGWEQFTYLCPVPFRHEDVALIKPPYHYTMVARRSGHRLLLLSFNSRIVEYLVDHHLQEHFRPPLRHVPIAVDRLVKALVAKPTAYAISFAHARVPAFGVSLRAVSFYGDDLAEASLFRDHASLMHFFTCGLRLATGGAELVRIGSEGMVSFYQRDEHSEREIEKALGFLRDAGYLSGDVLNPDPKRERQL